MKTSLPFVLLATASLCCGSAAMATGMQAQAKTQVKTVATSKTTTTKPGTAKPPVATRTTTRTAVASNGRMVTTKTSTGKTITYNCGKAGNANKAACKK